MVLELFYRNSVLNAYHPTVQRDFDLLLPRKSSFFKNQTLTVFEEHPTYWRGKKWPQRKLWNLFCWFFFRKYRNSTDDVLDFRVSTIVFWDMVGLYKAWRHSRGYPVNGQRTWSNGRSCSKNNLLLKVYRLKQLQATFGTRKTSNYVTLIQAEANNKLWMKTWPFEWLQGRYHAVRSKSRKGASIPVDVVNLAKAITTGYRRYGTGERWNKSKKALKTVTVGLPLYFARFVFGNLRKRYFRYQLTMLQPEAKKKKK